MSERLDTPTPLHIHIYVCIGIWKFDIRIVGEPTTATQLRVAIAFKVAMNLRAAKAFTHTNARRIDRIYLFFAVFFLVFLINL